MAAALAPVPEDCGFRYVSTLRPRTPSGLRGLPSGNELKHSAPVARRSPYDLLIPLPAAALDRDLLTGQERERAGRYVSLLAEEITDSIAAADRAADLTPPELQQATSWSDTLLRILDADDEQLF